MRYVPFIGAIFLAAGLVATPARAGVVLTFSDLSSDETLPSDLTALVEVTVTADELHLEIDNQSLYSIAQFFFNSDTTLTGLVFDSLSGANAAWAINGQGSDQLEGADGFGAFNWRIDFGSGADRLGPGVTNLILDMTGTTTEATIGTKFSSVPPGHTQAVAAMKFEAGPGGDSAYGATTETTTQVTPGVPEPASMILVVLGAAALVARREWIR